MELKKYNNILTSGRWSTKYPKDAQILALVGVAQKISYYSKKPHDKSNTSNKKTTKGEPAYIRDPTPWILEEPKGGVGNKNKDGKEYWWWKEQQYGKGRWVYHKPKDHGKRTGTPSSNGEGTKPSDKGDINKKLTLTKDFKAGLLYIKYKSDVHAFLSQLNINDQGNK